VYADMPLTLTSIWPDLGHVGQFLGGGAR